jgi:putative component of membrane protein insertase Oxa1/YidC/SpoIIIJ protein YidD
MQDTEPSGEEQQEAEKYVLEKELIRPKTSVFTVFKYFFVFITSIFGITVILYYLLRNYFSDIVAAVLYTLEEEPILSCIIIFIFCLVIGVIILLKNMVIGFVHLYQHYSPDEVRRNCLFKPTCSEYMILAIEKYGLIKGVLKSFGRFRRCHGETYSIDYP